MQDGPGALPWALPGALAFPYGGHVWHHEPQQTVLGIPSWPSRCGSAASSGHLCTWTALSTRLCGAQEMPSGESLDGGPWVFPGQVALETSASVGSRSAFWAHLETGTSSAAPSVSPGSGEEAVSPAEDEQLPAPQSPTANPVSPGVPSGTAGPRLVEGKLKVRSGSQVATGVGRSWPGSRLAGVTQLWPRFLCEPGG